MPWYLISKSCSSSCAYEIFPRIIYHWNTIGTKGKDWRSDFCLQIFKALSGKSIFILNISSVQHLRTETVKISVEHCVAHASELLEITVRMQVASWAYLIVLTALLKESCLVFFWHPNSSWPADCVLSKGKASSASRVYFEVS